MASASRLSSLEHHARPLHASIPGDFAALDDALGDARVVMLGEQNHGDGAAFALKARLVEHLHLHHDFDVLAFEADFFSLARTWRHARAANGQLNDIHAAVGRNVYSFWRNPPQMQALWSFIQQRATTSRPLALAGLDPRHTGPYAVEYLVPELEAYLVGMQPSLTEGEVFDAFRTLFAGVIEHEYHHAVSALQRTNFIRKLFDLRDALAREGGPEASFWRQELRNLVFAAWGCEGRDQGMAANLLWLARERYPERKIIVWAHNYHILTSREDLAAADPQYAREWAMFSDTSLGEAATRALRDDVYALGFISGAGVYNPLEYRGAAKPRQVSSRLRKA